MSDEDVLEAAGEWYRGVLDAVEGAMSELLDRELTPEEAALLVPSLVAALARRGYMIERETGARESGL